MLFANESLMSPASQFAGLTAIFHGGIVDLRISVAEHPGLC